MTEKNVTKNKERHQDLINGCLKGDRKSQVILYKLYYKTMFNTCLRMVQNYVEAEDIMQESFISAFNKMHQFKGEVTFGAWLKRITINKTIDHLKQKKNVFEELSDKIDLIENTETENEEKLFYEKQEKIKRAMENLPVGYKVIFSLYVFEGYDHDEISQILNISSSTSRSQFARAKKKLMDQIKDEQ